MRREGSDWLGLVHLSTHSGRSVDSTQVHREGGREGRWELGAKKPLCLPWLLSSQDYGEYCGGGGGGVGLGAGVLAHLSNRAWVGGIFMLPASSHPSSHSKSPQPRCLQSCWRLSRTSPSWAAASPSWPPCSLSCCTSMPGIPLSCCRACPPTAARHPSFFSTWSPRVAWASPEGGGQEAGDKPHCVAAIGSVPPGSPSLCVYEPRGWGGAAGVMSPGHGGPCSHPQEAE